MESAPQPKLLLKPWLTTVLLVVLFVAGLGIRLYDLTDLPNDFYMVRQYHSLVIARGMYYAAPDHRPGLAAQHGGGPVEGGRPDRASHHGKHRGADLQPDRCAGLDGPVVCLPVLADRRVCHLAAGKRNVHAVWRHHCAGLFSVCSICCNGQPGLPARPVDGGHDRLVAVGALPLGEIPYLETGHPGRGIDRADDLRQIGGGFSHAGRGSRSGDQPGLLETHFRR